jgi:hypothetical protein
MVSQINALYERDFNRWLETTIQQIQERRFQEVDWEHLLEELVDMGKSEKRAFTSNLMVLLAHLLKLQVQADAPDSMKGSWYASVIEHRARVKADLADNPSFKNFLKEAVKKAYQEARNLAIKQGRFAKFGVRQSKESEYPLECPFICDQILDDDFYG